MHDTKEKNKKYMLIIYVLIIIAAVVAVVYEIVLMGYARFVSSVSGTATADIANMICELKQATPVAYNDNDINPACDIVVTNYKTENGVTALNQTESRFTVTVALPPESEDTMPEYYWVDKSDDSIVAHSAGLTAIGSTTLDSSLPENLTGIVGTSLQENKNYKIVFINAENITNTKNIIFNISAEQARNED